MKKILRIVFRIFCGILAVYIPLYLCNSFLLKRDSASYLPIYEIKHRDDIEMVFIGSSIVRNGINPVSITDETGLESFNLGIPGMKFPGIETCIYFIEKKNRPKKIIVVAEPDVFTSGTPEETNMVERIWPHLDSPLIRFQYYLDLCGQNGAWIENALVFQRDTIETLDDFRKVLNISSQPEYYAREINARNPSVRYEGNGFLRVLVQDNPSYRLATEYHSWNGDQFGGISPDIIRRVRKVKNICDSMNAEMILMIPPTHTVNILSYPADMSALTEVEGICKEMGIPFWNFRMAKREVWPDLDPYFYDIGHLSGAGADLFSEALARFIHSYMDGNDVSSLFYDTWDDYLADAPLINAWLDLYFERSGQIHVAAGSNGGTNVVPEYQFSVLDDENEYIIQEYHENNSISIEYEKAAGKRICVKVRDRQHLERPPVSYMDWCP